MSEITLPAVLLGGLIDGVNPCAFSVLLSFVAIVLSTVAVGGAGRCSSGATASRTASATITPPLASTAMILPLVRLPWSGSATPYPSPGRPGGPAR